MPFYLPILKGPYSKPTPTDWIGEAPLACLTREQVVKDIESGQIDPAPVRVLEIDEQAGTVKDVTSIIAQDVGDLSLNEASEPPFDDLRDWLDKHKAIYFVPMWSRQGRRA